MRALLLLFLAVPLAARTVEIKAFSADTWVAWRSVDFWSASGRLSATCVKASMRSTPTCSSLATRKAVGAWNANDYSGTVKFKVDGEVDLIRLIPCCGDAVGVGLPAIAIEVRVDGKLVHRAVHVYSLNYVEGSYVVIEIPDEKQWRPK